MYPNIIYPLGCPKCDGCGYPTGAPIPLGAHKYCGDCYAKGNIKATARPLNSSEIEGLRQLLEERFGVEREEMTMKRVKRHRFTANEPSEEYRRAYNAALDDLTTWLRSAGY
jgi:hypothetical protein